MARLFTFLSVFLYSAVAFSAPFKIVGIGDSNSTGYGPIKLQLALNAQGISGNAYSMASGGATASTLAGLQTDGHYVPPQAHNFAYDAMEGTVYSFGPPWTYYDLPRVSGVNPNAIVVMIGSNDAMNAVNNPSYWTTYQSVMTDVYDYLSTATTPNGSSPQIFLSTVLPILPDPNNPVNAQANALVDNDFNPWIRDQAANYGFNLIDTNYNIQQVPDWQTMYSDDGINQGYLHLYAPGKNGYQWLANNFLYGILDTHAGDANLDGSVDGLDYVAWADGFGASGGSGNWSKGDFNHDGYVDGLDYVLWADHYGSGSARFPSSLVAVPEPSALASIIVGAVFVFVCRLVWDLTCWRRKKRG